MVVGMGIFRFLEKFKSCRKYRQGKILYRLFAESGHTRPGYFRVVGKRLVELGRKIQSDKHGLMLPKLKKFVNTFGVFLCG